jgi:hypothetical protein
MAVEDPRACTNMSLRLSPPSSLSTLGGGMRLKIFADNCSVTSIRSDGNDDPAVVVVVVFSSTYERMDEKGRHERTLVWGPHDQIASVHIRLLQSTREEFDLWPRAKKWNPKDEVRREEKDEEGDGWESGRGSEMCQSIELRLANRQHSSSKIIEEGFGRWQCWSQSAI